ncbi:MAG: NADP-dependent oxidoreductase [Thermoplasmata archaeon]
MPEGTNRQWVLSQRPKGLPEDPPRAEHFRWVESSIPNPGPGQVLVRNFWISMLPTNLMALTASSEEGGLELGAVIPSVTASRVIESRLPEYAPGDLLAGFAGWEDYSVVEGHGYIDTMKIPPEVPLNFALSALGIDGMVAYFGVLEVARPRKGETFVISAAAGGVGSIAAQIAKIHGLRVIGIAGGKEKCDWLVNEARVAAAIDHRTEQVGPRLDELCPKGIDIYFDNVGGPILDEALARLRRNGRIVVCGGTARYAQSTPLPGPANYLQLCMMNGRMEGLLGKDYFDRFPEAIAMLRGWIASGQLTVKEDVMVGLENAPAAFARLFSGANVGKQLLKITDDSENVRAGRHDEARSLSGVTPGIGRVLRRSNTGRVGLVNWD